MAVKSTMLAVAYTAASGSRAAAIRQSHVKHLGDFTSRTRLHARCSVSNSLERTQRNATSTAVQISERPSRKGKEAIRARVQRFQSSSMESQSTQGFPAPASTAIAVEEAPLARNIGTGEGNWSRFGGNSRNGGNSARGNKSYPAAAATAAIAMAIAANRSGDWGHDKIGKGVRGEGSLSWCREDENGVMREESLPEIGNAIDDRSAADAASSTIDRTSCLIGKESSDQLCAEAPGLSLGQHQEYSYIYRQQENATNALNFGCSESDLGHTHGAPSEVASVGGLEPLPTEMHRAAAAVVSSAVTVAAAATVLAESCATEKITDVYRFESEGEPVGRGHRSVVSSATHRLTGKRVAVKMISRARTSRLEVLEEVQMLKLAGAHPNVVKLQAFYEDKKAFYIVMDLCPGGELYRRLADKGRYSEGQAARIMAEVAEAVGFIHNHGIIHFDLKPENIMLAVVDDVVPEVRLADFGSAFRQHLPVSGAKGFTTAYSAPEVLACQDVDEKVDIWALGVIMWVLLTGRHPFDTNFDLSEEEVAHRIAHEALDLKSRGIRHVSPEGKDLIRWLLAKDPEDRPSARQMLSHPWFHAVKTRGKGPLRLAATRKTSTVSTASATCTEQQRSSSQCIPQLLSPGRRPHSPEPAVHTSRQHQCRRLDVAVEAPTRTTAEDVTAAVKGMSDAAAASIAGVATV